MGAKIKIIIVDDHDMFRTGLRVLLGKSDNIEIIAEAENGQKFLDLLDKHTPDVVLMDIRMPVMDGIEATRLGLEKKPDMRILSLSMFGDEEYYYKMIHSGVKGFVLKSAGINELEKAIDEIARDSCYFSPELLQHVINNITDKPNDNKPPQLNKAEIDILNGICKNQSFDELAQHLNITSDDVKTTFNKLLTKTNSTSSSGLVLYAIKNKLVSL